MSAGCTWVGLNLQELQARYRHELFDLVLPFWDRFGIDHEQGGFWCSLDYDGTRIDGSKHPWFQGRGLWVYSHLYLHFGRDPRPLEIARKAKDYVLGHLNREGEPYARYFAAEGLMAYAAAAGDDGARLESKRLMTALFHQLHGPAVAKRPQGVWMMTLAIATQWLRHWIDPEIQAMADTALDAIIHRHYNPETGLNTEHYRLNAPDVMQETIDGEVIIVHVVTGAYYSLVGSGATIWSDLLRGTDHGVILDRIAPEGDARRATVAAELEAFIAELSHQADESGNRRGGGHDAEVVRRQHPRHDQEAAP